MLKGEHWLKVHGHYHHLGAWNGEYRVLYCGNTTQVATWLRYEPLTENFEIVASPFGQRSLSDAPVSSYLSRMVNRLYPEDDWPTYYSLADVHDSFLSGDDLSLRLRQTALLQRLAPGERMALLSLPSAQIYSWSMHPDAMALRSRYPVLSLWLSWQRQIFPLLNSTTTASMRLEKTLTLNNAYINGKAASGSLSAGGYGSHDAMWIQHSVKGNSSIALPTAYRLFHSEDIFYGEMITGLQGMSSWCLESDDVPLPTVSQFSYDIKPKAEITTDIYRKIVTFYTPYLGTFTLDPSPSRSKILLAVYAPNYGWFATLDEERYISLYRVNSPEKIYSDHFDNVLKLEHRLISPDDVDTKRVALSFIDNAGRYFYSDGISWRNAVDKQYIWQPEQGFSPLFVSPEHDFLGYGNGDNATLLLFQVHRGYSILLQSFSSAPKHNVVTAVAFSPLNVLVAIAYSDDFVYVYNIADAKPNAVVYPLFYADLTSGISSLLNYWHNVPKSAVLRFEGIFTHLEVIHDVHNVSDTGIINNSSYLY